MTQITDITVKNGAATPADQVFTAFQPQAGSEPAVWYAKTGDKRIGWSSFTASVRRTNGTNKASKLQANFVIPLVDSLGARVGEIPASFSITLPDTATQLDINNATAYVTNLLSSSFVKSMITTGTPAI